MEIVAKTSVLLGHDLTGLWHLSKGISIARLRACHRTIVAMGLSVSRSVVVAVRSGVRCFVQSYSITYTSQPRECLPKNAPAKES